MTGKKLNNLYGIVGGICCGKDVTTNIIQKIGKEKGINFSNEKFGNELKKIVALLLNVDVEKMEDRVFKNTILPEYEITEVTYEHKNYLKKTVRFMSSLFNDEVLEKNKLEHTTSLQVRKINVTPRWLMINIGTNCFRDIISIDFWVIQLFRKFNESSNWVISDVRFRYNEGSIVKKNNGVLIGVRRKFSLRFPEYEHLEDITNPYSIPVSLSVVNKELYETLTSESEIHTHELSWCDYIVDNDGTIEELEQKIREICLKE